MPQCPLPDFTRFRGIARTLGGFTALRDVSLDIAQGKCHGPMAGVVARAA